MFSPFADCTDEDGCEDKVGSPYDCAQSRSLAKRCCRTCVRYGSKIYPCWNAAVVYVSVMEVR